MSQPFSVKDILVPDAGSPTSPVAPFPQKKPVAGAKRPSSDKAGRFRRVGGAEMAPVLLDGQARTGIRRFPYRMLQDSQFVRKQGVSRTECSRTVGSYENKAIFVPDASGRSFRTETGRFSYRMRDHQPAPLLHFRRKSRPRDQNDPPALLDGRFRRVVGAERAPGIPDG